VCRSQRNGRLDLVALFLSRSYAIGIKSGEHLVGLLEQFFDTRAGTLRGFARDFLELACGMDEFRRGGMDGGDCRSAARLPHRALAVRERNVPGTPQC
jgi:hypothetical protein